MGLEGLGGIGGGFCGKRVCFGGVPFAWRILLIAGVFFSKGRYMDGSLLNEDQSTNKKDVNDTHRRIAELYSMSVTKSLTVMLLSPHPRLTLQKAQSQHDLLALPRL